MTASERCVYLIKQFEGCRLRSYKDPVGLFTIGYGVTVYPSGRKVGPGELITQAQAEEFLKFEIDLKAMSVNELTRDLGLSQGQFDALVSFAYNLGVGALKRSTLLKKVRIDPDDITIAGEFRKWVRAGGKVLAGLVRRRKAESDLYFS